MSRFRRKNEPEPKAKKLRGRPRKIELGPAEPASAPPIDESPSVPFKLNDARRPVDADRNAQTVPVRDLLRNLGSIHATTREAAAILGIEEKTLFTFFDREPEARDIFEGGKELGRVSLRRKQFNLADKNATMAIFLGMNYLGQQDMRFLAMKGHIDHTISPLGRLLQEIDAGRSGKVIEHDKGEVAPTKQIAPEGAEG
jgi:hypothetical protein